MSHKSPATLCRGARAASFNPLRRRGAVDISNGWVFVSVRRPGSVERADMSSENVSQTLCVTRPKRLNPDSAIWPQKEQRKLALMQPSISGLACKEPDSSTIYTHV